MVYLTTRPSLAAIDPHSLRTPPPPTAYRRHLTSRPIISFIETTFKDPIVIVIQNRPIYERLQEIMRRIWQHFFFTNIFYTVFASYVTLVDRYNLVRGFWWLRVRFIFFIVSNFCPDKDTLFKFDFYSHNITLILTWAMTSSWMIRNFNIIAMMLYIFYLFLSLPQPHTRIVERSSESE